MAAAPTAYADCADTATYAALFTIADPNYLPAVTAVNYWDGAAFVPTCVAGSDSGVQRLELAVSSSDAMVSEVLSLVIRRPCRVATEFPLDPPCA